ncbi:peptide chain release factor N(5)-glutamine methyltransferase [Kordiimonas lipolytica]|uniref:Release factor glutamine methyltransferase n=1 Tax=Kordiimonas lipolytica TaxID=1662421 RepID=A0ABV8U4U8_9PROT|nr:peptide chain release factor N(5)-glutamine methyltransferase [Kordiimonas lipolytica]
MSVADTLLSQLKAAEVRLALAGIETARLDAEILMAHVLGCPRMALYGKLTAAVPQQAVSEFDALLSRRLTCEPVAYITGEQEFWSLPFKVTPDTLIPRPDTETLVETVLRQMDGLPVRRVLDLGTGSGCILLSLLHELRDALGTAVDISAGALSVAKENAVSLDLQERVEFFQGSWFAPLDKQAQFDVIVSNPPYIPSKDMAGLMADVRLYEPGSALDGGEDGLGPYRLIADQAPAFLAPGGLLAVEVGIHQAGDVMALFDAAGLVGTGKVKDLGGVERVLYGKKS